MAETNPHQDKSSQKHNRWKSNPHPDNIILPRKPPPKKNKASKNQALDPVDLTSRLNAHLGRLKLEEQNGIDAQGLREMDWEQIRRAQAPRIGHSRQESRLEIRKEPMKMKGFQIAELYEDPRAVAPRTESSETDRYAADMRAAYRTYSPRTESSGTGVYPHFRGTPLRKESNADTFYTESMDLASSETSRTSSRGSGIGERIKSFQGLPPLFFQVSDGNHTSETTLSTLESGLDKLDLFSDTASSLFSTNTKDPVAHPVAQSFNGDPNRPMSSMTDISDAESVPVFLRQSQPPQEPLSMPPRKNMLLQEPPVISERPSTSTSFHDPLPILTLNEAPSEAPPKTADDAIQRGRGLQISQKSLTRSVSSDDTYRPIQQTASYTYWRASRPESWGPGDEEIQSQPDIDSYYFMNDNAVATNNISPQFSHSNAAKQQSMPTQAGPIKRVFGFKSTKNINKSLPAPPPPFGPGVIKTVKTNEDTLFGVLPDDFPMQRKNFLGLFKR